MRAYRSLLAGAGARRLALASVLGWLGFGALSLAIVLTVQHATGSPSAAGAALAGFALGSGVLAAFAAASAAGALVYGTRRAAADRRYVLGTLALTVILLPLAALGSVWTLAAVLLAAGAAFAAVNVATYALLDEVAPEGTGAEALTWLTTAGAAGMAAGAAAAGALAGAGHIGGALALPAAGAAFSTGVIVVRRATVNDAG